VPSGSHALPPPLELLLLVEPELPLELLLLVEPELPLLVPLASSSLHAAATRVPRATRLAYVKLRIGPFITRPPG